VTAPAPTPTQDEYDLANAVLGYLSSIPGNLYPSANALAAFIATHRAPMTTDYDDVLRQRGLQAAFSQAADDATKLRVHLADPAQVHAAELETALSEMIEVAHENECAEGRRTQHARALLAELDSERKKGKAK